VAKPAVEIGAGPISDPVGSSQDGSPPGEGRRDRPGRVFWISVAVAAAFVVLGVFATDTFNDALGAVVDHIIDGLGWLYLLITTGFVGFVLWLAFSRYGSIRLGKDGENPEFGLFSWFAMLFQAGMGIGLLFWGVSEPVLHTVQPLSALSRPERRTPRHSASSTRSFTGAFTQGRSTPSSDSRSATSAIADELAVFVSALFCRP
jgi:BCCT, betaine/carnitine/choline family transporter